MSNICGQKTVTTAGSAEPLAPSRQINAPLMVKALHANTGLVYIGQVDGDVSSADGLPLAAGEAAIFENVGNLAEIWLDADVDGEGAAWLILNC